MDLWDVLSADHVSAFSIADWINDAYDLPDHARDDHAAVIAARHDLGDDVDLISGAESVALDNAYTYWSVAGPKRWIPSPGTTRHDNVGVNGDGTFRLDSAHSARYPGDPRLDVSQRQNCRCVLAADVSVSNPNEENLMPTNGPETSIDALALQYSNNTNAVFNTNGANFNVGVIHSPFDDDDEFVEWSGTIALEGKPTGDGRFIERGALYWETEFFPLPYAFQPRRAESHMDADIVGTLDRIERQDDRIVGFGRMRNTPQAREIIQLIEDDMFVYGPSVDLDSLEADFSVDDEGNMNLTVTRGRIRGFTVVPIAAFIETSIEVDVSADDQDRFMPGLVASASFVWDVKMEQGALVASVTAPPLPAWAFAPTRSVFDAPADDVDAVPWTISADGEVFGHVALWNSKHISYIAGEVYAPRSATGYAYYHSPGQVLCEDGSTVDVGRVFMHANHAPLDIDAKETVDHYAHTGTLVATVRAHETRHGIYVAGVLAPECTEQMAATARATDISGDWRSIDGNLEMVGLLCVNVGGFQKGSEPRSRYALAASGEPSALVITTTPAETVDNELAVLRQQMEAVQFTLAKIELEKVFS